ncbi:MAG TPA: type II toxin-antitoxin system VapC family toxin [Thermoanaerobaculia bacterium]|nr:type II toxin-antitoxin system VapC family toxin [Thermoanaerobaculia bacterium]
MKPIVLDASALVEYLLRTPRSLTLIPWIEAETHDLHIPALGDVEFASGIVRLLVRELISEQRAAEALEDLIDLPLSRHGHLALLPRAISLRSNFSVYDAIYVALAERLDATLITADEKLAGAVARHTTVQTAPASSGA